MSQPKLGVPLVCMNVPPSKNVTNQIEQPVPIPIMPMHSLHPQTVFILQPNPFCEIVTYIQAILLSGNVTKTKEPHQIIHKMQAVKLSKSLEKYAYGITNGDMCHLCKDLHAIRALHNCGKCDRKIVAILNVFDVNDNEAMREITLELAREYFISRIVTQNSMFGALCYRYLASYGTAAERLKHGISLGYA